MGQTNYLAYSIACFTLGTTAYFGTGIDDNAVYYNNFSSFDPINGSMVLTAFGGTNRYNASAFAISGRGYMGTGYDSWVTNDWWEYTPQSFSVTENNFENLISVFPNPTSTGIITVIASEAKQSHKIEIYDTTGKKVFETTADRGLSTKLDLSFLQTGVYYLHFTSEGKIIVKKFVKI